jgi:tRNA-modifying protein YgfZ
VTESPAPGDGLAEIAADYEALRRGCGAYPLVRDVVSVHGPDAADYLQGQVSQDVSALAVGASAPALVLEPDGKLCALVRVTRTDDGGYVLDTDGGFGASVAARLRRFRLRTKVEIEPLSWPCVALRGDGVPASTAVGGGGRDPAGPATPLVLPVEWNGTRGLDRLGPGAADGLPDAVRWCGAPAWEALRVEAGIPSMGTELNEHTIAAEAGLVARTVSFTKGCYTGQELVARLDARGARVPRRLRGVVFTDFAASSPVPPAGAELRSAGKVVGELTSVAMSPATASPIALALVRREIDPPADCETDFGPAAVEQLPMLSSGPLGPSG